MESNNSLLSCCLSRKDDYENSKRTIQVSKDIQREKIQKRNGENENAQEDTSSPTTRKSKKQRSTTTTPLKDSELLTGRLTANQIELAEELKNKDGIEGVIEDLKTPIYTYEQWLKILKNNDLENTSMTEVIHSLRHGVKNELRPMIWEFLIKLETLKSQHPSDYYKKLKGKTNAQDQDIKKDVAKTFGDHQFFTDASSQGETLLFNILRAYANHDTELGYVHGMNFIVGKLLIIMEPDNYGDSELKYFQKFEENFEEKIFWILVHINSVQNWRQVYRSNFPKMQGLIAAFESRLKLKNPEVYNILKTSKLDFLKCFQTMFSCLFMDSSPLPIAKRLLDLFFIEEEKILFKFLIRAMTLCKDEILDASKDSKLEQFLKNDLLEVCGHKYRADLYVVFPEADSLD